jgi:hypothetical protein
MLAHKTLDIEAEVNGIFRVGKFFYKVENIKVTRSNVYVQRIIVVGINMVI